MTAIVPMPSGMEVLSEGGATVLRRRWLSWTVIPLTFFCVFWNGFLVFWFGQALRSGRWEMAAFASLHVAVGVGLAYFIAATFFNKTDVVISGAGVRVRTHPVPWVGNVFVAASDMTQLYTKEVLHHRKNGVSRTYQVHIIDRTGRERALVKGLTSSEQGLFVEKTVEQNFGITDASVRGEIPR